MIHAFLDKTIKYGGMVNTNFKSYFPQRRRIGAYD